MGRGEVMHGKVGCGEVMHGKVGYGEVVHVSWVMARWVMDSRRSEIRWIVAKVSGF